jgi:hypothetical protein
MAPTLSTFIKIGSVSSIPIDYNNCLTNMTAFVSSDEAKYSASVDDKVTLLPDFDFQSIGAPQK